MTEKTVLCFSVEQESRAELVARSAPFAQALQAALAVLVLSANPEDEHARLGGYGADHVYVVEDPLLEPYNPILFAEALVRAVEEIAPALVVVGGTHQGLEVAARAAQRLGVRCLNDLLGVEPADEGIRIRSLLFSGRGEAVYAVDEGLAFATIAPKLISPEPQSDRKAEVHTVTASLKPGALEVVEVKGKESFDRGLERAEVVVDFGQGIAQREDIAMIEKLAGLLHGQVGCSRPIASEREWMPDFIGLSGKRVAPRFCLMVGISGAVQHMVGLRDAELIVAINNNPDAAIFQQTDYGLVADLYQVVPALISRLERRGG